MFERHQRHLRHDTRTVPAVKLCTDCGVVTSRAGSRCADHARQSNRSRHNVLYSTRAWQRLSARVLREATMKHALAELAEAHDANADIPALAKVLHRRLRVDPRGVAPTARGAETMVRLLAGFAQIPQGLAELRNEGYGTGHGQVTRISGIKPRHADLAARSAIAYAAFILETLADPEAPWR